MPHDYLTFESECYRLKDYFLLEAEEANPNDDDLAEGTNEPEEEESKGKDEADDTPKEGDDGKTGDEEKDDAEAEEELSDLDGDSDLGDITGNPGDAPTGDEVNKDNGAPGAINPENLLRELAEGEDNVYTRVINAMKEKFPGGKCLLKDLVEPMEKATAHAVKSFMKNKNYAPLPKEAMKGVCDNITNTILKKCSESDTPEPKPEPKPANEAIFYVKKSPVFESEEMMEGMMKNIALAAAIGAAGAGGANAATAESAPYATKSPTPLFQKQQQEANKKAEQKKAEVMQAKGKSSGTTKSSSSSAPNAKDPSSVVFSNDSTYNLTPDDYMTYKMANNLPAHYVVAGGSDGAASGGQAKSAKSGAGSSDSKEGKSGTKPGVGKSGTGSATQAAVKSDTKSSVKKGGKSGGSSNERCAAPQEKSEGFGHMLHRLAHKAVDKGGEIASGLAGGVAGAVKGGYKGANAGYRYVKNELEKDHDKMIRERNSHH